MPVFLKPKFAVPTMALVSVAVAVAIGLNYWGYLIAPPPARAVTAPFVEVSGVHLVSYDAAANPTVVPIAELPTVHQDFPPTRVLSALQGRVNGEATELSTERAAQIAAALQAQGIVLGDISDTGSTQQVMVPEQGWQFYGAFLPAGFVVEGVGQDGQPLVLANIAARSGDADDHYAYHEFLFSADATALQPLVTTSYFFDQAGIEGLTAPVIAMGIFGALLLVWSATIILTRVVQITASGLRSLPRGSAPA